jgi:hypothetical protein
MQLRASSAASCCRIAPQLHPHSIARPTALGSLPRNGASRRELLGLLGLIGLEATCVQPAQAESKASAGRIGLKRFMAPLHCRLLHASQSPHGPITNHHHACISGDWSSPGLNAPENPDLPKFFKTASGVKVQELLVGSGGVAAKKGDSILFDYVLRRANGYFIYGTVEGVSFQPQDTPVGPVAFRLGDGALIPGLEEVLVGMRKGGKRRALIPASAGYSDCGRDEPQPPTFGTKRQLQSHCTEPLLFELELLRITPA